MTVNANLERRGVCRRMVRERALSAGPGAPWELLRKRAATISLARSRSRTRLDAGPATRTGRPAECGRRVGAAGPPRRPGR